MKTRNLSFNHWRYKLLHWFFNVDPKDVNLSPHNARGNKLPDYLYTHYCPLFHITNFLLVLFPFAFASVKFGQVLFFLLNKFTELNFVVNLNERLNNWIDKIQINKQQYIDDTATLRQEKLIELIKVWTYNRLYDNKSVDLDDLYDYLCQKHSNSYYEFIRQPVRPDLHLSNNDINNIIDKVKDEYKSNLDSIQAEKDFFIRLIRIGEIGFRCVVSLIMIALTLFIVYGLYVIIAIIGLLNIIFGIITVAFIAGIVYGVIVVASAILESDLADRIWNSTMKAIEYPFSKTANFTKLFYEAHCPPINVKELNDR